MTTEHATKVVYISIGNSDDKLPQSRWNDFQEDFYGLIMNHNTEKGFQTHGVWFSNPISRFQNMCVCVEMDVIPVYEQLDELVDALRGLAAEYEQDTIAWAEVQITKFLPPL